MQLESLEEELEMLSVAEKPIRNVSRTLSAAEKNYSQLEKGRLSCVFGVKCFHS